MTNPIEAAAREKCPMPDSNPKEIYLEPPPGDPGTGRQWCKDDVWAVNHPDYNGVVGTKYIRADAVAAKDAEINRQRTALREILEWADAYPVERFAEIDVDAVRKQFGGDAMFSRLHASWARQIVVGVGAKARKGLGT